MTANDEYRRIAAIYDPAVSGALRPLRRSIRDSAVAAGRSPCLDLCCGTGEQADILARTGLDVTGVDNSPAMLAVARRKRPTLPVVLADAAALPFPDASFALAGLTLALHEKPYELRLGILAEARRVLTPDGVLLIADYAASGARLLPVISVIERMAGREHHRHYADFQRRGGLPPLLAETGFGFREISRHAAGTIVVLECFAG